MELQIVNPDPKYANVKLIEPTPFGYIHIAAAVQPRSLPFSIFMPNGRAKSALLARLKELAQQLEQHDAIKRVTLFDAIAIPPVARLSSYLKQRANSLHVPHFDIVVLIETTSPADAHAVQAVPVYRALVDALQSKANDMHIMVARNAKRIGNVDETKKGLFLFNYFVGDDAQVTLQLWDYLAGWYAVETGLDNSILLVPLDGEHANYVAINHARWDESLPEFLWQQLAKPSFRNYVLANLEANRVGSMPLLYRLAPSQPAVLASPWVIALGAVALGAGLAGGEGPSSYLRPARVPAAAWAFGDRGETLSLKQRNTRERE